MQPIVPGTQWPTPAGRSAHAAGAHLKLVWRSEAVAPRPADRRQPRGPERLPAVPEPPYQLTLATGAGTFDERDLERWRQGDLDDLTEPARLAALTSLLSLVRDLTDAMRHVSGATNV